MYSVRRTAMTLLEVLIAFAILSLIGGVVGIHIRWTMQQQKFRSEVALMVDTLRLAQDLMLILGTDVSVRIQPADKGKGIEYWLDVEEGVPKAWEPIIRQTRRSLKETHNITLEPTPVANQPFALKFFSGGSLMSKGIFFMSTHENVNASGALTAVICLKGYPHPIVSAYGQTDSNTCENLADQETDHRLTAITVQEIQEDNEIKKNFHPKKYAEPDEIQSP